MAEIKLAGSDQLELFELSTAEWLCDPYSIDISYTAVKEKGMNVILSCSINLWPIGSNPESSFNLIAENFLAGKEVIPNVPLNSLKVFIEKLVKQGSLTIKDQEFKLAGSGGFNYFSEMTSNDRWHCEGHLTITGDHRIPHSNSAIAKIDNALRLNQTPFDGLQDLASFLNLPIPLQSDTQPRLEIRVFPPIDILSDESNLKNDSLTLQLHAHPKFSKDTIGLAIQTFPTSLKDRKQIAADIKWSKGKDNLQTGKVVIQAKKAFAVKVILMAGSNMVRRQFFEDSTKLPNKRLVSVSHFDKKLKRLKQSLLSKDSMEFEIAVNGLAYMLGLAGSVLNETNAPDIILSTPEDNLVVIECTTRIADFHSKLGKLVDRKNSLAKELNDSGDPRKVYAYLVCGLPKDQIAATDIELAKNKVTLLSKESLDDLFNQLQFPQNIEKLLQQDEQIIESLLSHSTDQDH